MKTFILSLLLVSAVAQADQPVALLVEERDDGKPAQMILVHGETVAATTESEKKFSLENFWENIRVTKAIVVTSPLPFTGAGGRIGLTTPHDMIEVGAEAQIFVIPPGNERGHGGSLGASLGAYLQIAPIPGKWGKRFYLKGSVFQAFNLIGRPSFTAFGVGGALGYRQPFDHQKKFFFMELGLERDYLFTYDDVLITPRLTVGVRF